MKGYGVKFTRVDPGLYEAFDEDGTYVGGIYKHETDGLWHAQALRPSTEATPFKADVFDSLKWAKRFVLSNVSHT